MLHGNQITLVNGGIPALDGNTIAPPQQNLPVTGADLADAPVRLGPTLDMTGADPALAGLQGDPGLVPPPKPFPPALGGTPIPDGGKPSIVSTPPVDPALVPNSTASPQPTVNVGDLQEGFTAVPVGPTIVESVQANKAAGDAYENHVIANDLLKVQTNIQSQITIKSNSPSGLSVRVDAIGQDANTGAVRLSDMKASSTAPLTPNSRLCTLNFNSMVAW